jgi:hypothetical protein
MLSVWSARFVWKNSSGHVAKGPHLNSGSVMKLEFGWIKYWSGIIFLDVWDVIEIDVGRERRLLSKNIFTSYRELININSILVPSTRKPEGRRTTR